MSDKAYQRVLLKLSGEALKGERAFGLDGPALKSISSQIQKIYQKKVHLGVVIGGGNLFRGIEGEGLSLPKDTADTMGMLATTMNAMALYQALLNIGIKACVLGAMAVEGKVEAYSKEKMLAAFEKEEVVIFSGGTGNPYSTTDSAAALRALQMGAEILLKGTKVDGVFDGDPVKNPSAKKYEKVTYQEVLENRLKVMDMAAIALCQEHSLPIRIFDVFQEGALEKAVLKAPIGTIVSNVKEDSV